MQDRQETGEGAVRSQCGGHGGSTASDSVKPPPCPPLDGKASTLLATQPGPPPRQHFDGPAQEVYPPRVLEPVRPLARIPARELGWTSSAAIHLSVIVLVSLLLGPMAIDRKSNIELTVTAQQLQPEPEPVLTLIKELEVPQPTPIEKLDEDLFQSVYRQSGLAGDSKNAPQKAGGGSGEGTGQRGTFFGTVADGNEFVYVIDISGSMQKIRDRAYKENRFEYARRELLRSVRALSEDQYFYVFLFADRTQPMFDEHSPLPVMLPATPENKNRLEAWLRSVRPNGGTDPREAVQLALRLNPNAIFLLSDGKFNGQERRNGVGLLRGNEDVHEVIASFNEANIAIHTIAYEEKSGSQRMEAIAQQTGGTYRFVPPLPPQAVVSSGAAANRRDLSQKPRAIPGLLRESRSQK